MSRFKQIAAELEASIVNSYTEGTSLHEAEKLAGKLLHAQLMVSGELRKSDLDSRMKKAGLKTVRAAAYLEIVQNAEGKKPTEAGIAALIDTNELVQGEQTEFDKAEVERDELERYYKIFESAHIHFRTIAKGAFGG